MPGWDIISALRREAEDVLGVLEEGSPEVSHAGVRDLLHRLRSSGDRELLDYAERINRHIN